MEVNVAIGNENSSGMFFRSPINGRTPADMPATGAAVLALLITTSSTWALAGAVGEEGPSWTPFGSTESIRLWDLSVARAVETEKGSMTIPVVSTTADSMKTVFGAGAVTPTAKGFVVDASDGLKNVEESYVLYGQDGADDLIWTCERGMVTDIAEVGLTPTGALIWNITITGGWKFVKDTPEGSTGNT